VSSQRRTHPGRPTAAPLAALCAALFVIFALVAPVFAIEGPTRLYDASVSPRTGTPSTTITFTVGYRNREGSAPASVKVLIDGTAHAMVAASGTNWKSGVLNHWSTTLRAGTHTISFAATSRDKFSDTAAGGTVKITVPPPAASPKPTPKPTSDATPAATPRPTPTPRPTSSPSQVPPAMPSAGTGGTGGDTSNSTGDTGTSGVGGTGPGSGGYLVNAGVSGGSTDGTSAGGNSLVGADTTEGSGSTAVSTDGDGSTGGPASGHDVVTGGTGWGAFASALETLGIKHPPAISMVPMLVGTSTAMTMAFAFAIFGKKRRDEEPPAPDEVLRANAARGQSTVPTGDIANGVVRAATVPGPIDTEAGMPRWRRPSLLEARKADPSRSIASNHRMSFENGVAAAPDGRERRTIRYAVVRLLDAPDELRSAEIGQLDQGDEVQLIERSGSYWLVLCPDGRQGWLHKMTLGDVVSDAAPNVLSREIDDDVLMAFLTARARA
jgi:hypothetical protein